MRPSCVWLLSCFGLTQCHRADRAARDAAPPRAVVDAAARDAAEPGPSAVFIPPELRDGGATRDDVGAPVDDLVTSLEDVPATDAPRLDELPLVSTLNQPMRVIWPAVNRWNDRMEREYSEFVLRLGQAVAQHRCGRLDVCLRNREYNTLYDAAADGRLALDVDCGDLPYILRAYFAFKRRLPFGFVAYVSGRGSDPRYMLNVRPFQWRTWQQFDTPRRMLRDMVSYVHTGIYRIPGEVETGDMYPPLITRHAIVPGTTYYDPNGHVLVVVEVRNDGTVFLMDGHPDGSLTYKRFGEAFALGPRILEGGFKNFRPLTWDGTTLRRATNVEIPDYGGATQWSQAAWQVGLDGGVRLPDGGVGPRTYHQWVRDALATAGSVRDPVRDFREEIQGLCRDIHDRADAVDMGLAAGQHRLPHPSSLPWNIYGTMGDWETYSTPSRDARLKAALREMYNGVAAIPQGSPLIPQLRTAWAEETARPECATHYVNSAGATVTLSFTQVIDRMYAISFDPYHCPELRWGAPAGSPERATCPDGADKVSWYNREQRLRNQIDRYYGVPTPVESGVAAGPEVDPRTLLGITR